MRKKERSSPPHPPPRPIEFASASPIDASLSITSQVSFNPLRRRLAACLERVNEPQTRPGRAGTPSSLGKGTNGTKVHHTRDETKQQASMPSNPPDQDCLQRQTRQETDPKMPWTKLSPKLDSLRRSYPTVQYGCLRSVSASAPAPASAKKLLAVSLIFSL